LQKTSACASGLRSLDIADKPAVNGHVQQAANESAAVSESSAASSGMLIITSVVSELQCKGGLVLYL